MFAFSLLKKDQYQFIVEHKIANQHNKRAGPIVPMILWILS